MNKPKLFFNQAIVKKLGQIIAKVDTWQGMTIPEGVPEAIAKIIDKVPPQFPKVKQILQLIKMLKAGIYFVDVKAKVDSHLFKHEIFHWNRGQEIGGVKYFELLAGQYLIYKYENAPEEKAANAYGKGKLTPEEQAIFDAA